MWWRGPWHMLMPVLFLGLIVAGIIILVRKRWPEDNRAPSGVGPSTYSTSAMQRGEIDREEYQRRKQDILGR